MKYCSNQAFTLVQMCIATTQHESEIQKYWEQIIHNSLLELYANL